jgi:predicted membrane protein
MTTVDLKDRPVGTDPSPNRPAGYGAVVLGAVLVVVGALWFLDGVGVLALRAAIVLPAMLAVVGLSLVLGAANGPHRGLVVFGAFLTVAVLAAAVTPPDAFHGGIGERTYTVADQAELAPRYDVGVGDLRLDLSDLVLTESAVVDVTVGAGEMRIRVPDDIALDVDASVGAGELVLFDERNDGMSISKAYTSADFEEAEVTLTLDLSVAAGTIEVTR